MLFSTAFCVTNMRQNVICDVVVAGVIARGRARAGIKWRRRRSFSRRKKIWLSFEWKSHGCNSRIYAYIHHTETELGSRFKGFCPRSWKDHLYSSTQLTTRTSQNLGEQPFRQALSLYRPAASWKRAFKATEGIKRCLSVSPLPSLRRCVPQLWHFHSKLCRLIQSRIASSTRKITTSSNLFLAHIV